MFKFSQSVQVLDLFDEVIPCVIKNLPRFKVVKLDSKERFLICSIKFIANLLQKYTSSNFINWEILPNNPLQANCIFLVNDINYLSPAL